MVSGGVGECGTLPYQSTKMFPISVYIKDSHGLRWLFACNNECNQGSGT